MEEYLGNEDLLDRYLVALFASREYSEEVAQRAVQWAEEICQTDKVVISGFHSPLEKEVLRILLEHKHPVVVALGRALYKRVPPNLQAAFDEGRLLFDHQLTPFFGKISDAYIMLKYSLKITRTS